MANEQDESRLTYDQLARMELEKAEREMALAQQQWDKQHPGGEAIIFEQKAPPGRQKAMEAEQQVQGRDQEGLNTSVMDMDWERRARDAVGKLIERSPLREYQENLSQEEVVLQQMDTMQEQQEAVASKEIELAKLGDVEGVQKAQENLGKIQEAGQEAQQKLAELRARQEEIRKENEWTNER